MAPEPTKINQPISPAAADVTTAHHAARAGSPADAILNNDLTNRKDTEEQFGTLADLMPTICWMADADGWIFWYNRHWYEYTGTTPEQMQGWGWQSVHDPAVLPEVLEIWKRSIETGQPFEMTFPLKGADGEFRPFLTRITPVREADGRIFRWLGVNTDVSEERRASELREQFMAVLGHDLRNPLGAITAGLMLLQRTPLDDRATRLAEMMGKSASRMGALIEDIMDLARCRLGGGLALNRDAAEPLGPVLKGVIAELTIVSPDRVEIDDLSLDEPVNCDRGRIAQLFSNLLGNALTHGSEDRPIRVRAISGVDDFELSVTNGGEPISPGDLPRLFQPFYRGAVRPSREGLGLGLYIAHEIATAHGGTLEVASTQEETRFTFRMPMKNPEARPMKNS